MRVREVGAVALLVLGLAGCASHGGSAGIQVDAPDALVDQRVHVKVTGLAADEKVTVAVTTTDRDGKRWASKGSFTADAAGTVDLDHASPAPGSTYQTADGMGLIWSMAQEGADPDSAFFYPDRAAASYTVRLTVDSVGHELAHRDLVRQVQAAGVTRRDFTVAADGFVGSMFLPAAGPAARVGVLVLSGSDGGIQRLQAAMLAAHGFPALALGYFSQPGTPPTLKDIPLEYFETAAQVLTRQSGVKTLVADGFSRGSEAALLLANHYPALFRGAVLFSPSDQVNVSYPDGKVQPGR